MKFEREMIQRVHFDGACIEVGTYADAPNTVELRTVGQKNVEYFGAINIPLEPAIAMELGKALIEVAQSVELMKEREAK